MCRRLLRYELSPACALLGGDDLLSRFSPSVPSGVARYGLGGRARYKVDIRAHTALGFSGRGKRGAEIPGYDRVQWIVDVGRPKVSCIESFWRIEWDCDFAIPWSITGGVIVRIRGAWAKKLWHGNGPTRGRIKFRLQRIRLRQGWFVESILVRRWSFACRGVHDMA